MEVDSGSGEGAGRVSAVLQPCVEGGGLSGDLRGETERQEAV